jgi:hypothetical protein
MIKRLSGGILFIIFGLLVAIGPHTIFPVCGARDGEFMKCHWMAQAELGIGLGITIMGVLLIIFKSRQIRIGISIALLMNAILVILLPKKLIGVCSGVHMNCHALTLPALNLLGVLTLITAAATILYLWNANRKEGSL